MAFSGSCARCSAPLAADSAARLCPTCLASGETLLSSPAASGAVGPAGAVVTGGPVDPVRPDGATSAFPGIEARSGLPPAPPGYELVRPLGHGGMGDVFLAREQATERVVAMKFLRARGNPGAVDRFLVEVRALALIDHPHIVKVLATDFQRADPFFAMEYAPGGSLAERVRERGPLPPAEAAGVMAVVARAVHAAHEAGVLHRDLKPGNILLAADGTPRVSDFGLAKRTDRDDGVSLASGPLGTVGFMPPEQVSSRYGELGRAADVYGLGATLYHLLTGRPPFAGPRREEVLARAVADPPARPRVLRPDVPAGLEAVVMKCLEKNPAGRFATAAELAGELEKCAAGGEPDTRPLTWPRRAGRWVAWHRVRLAAAGLATLLLAAAFTLGAAVWNDPSRGNEPPDLAAEVAQAPAGVGVPLLDPENRPRHSRWLVGSGVFRPPTPENPDLAFSARDYAFLELCPDPGVDHYVFSVGLSHFGSAGKGEAGANYRVGVFYDFQTRRTPDGRSSAHTFSSVMYSDLQPNAVPGPTYLEVHDRLLIVRELEPTVSAKHRPPEAGADVEFPPVERLPGPWRQFDVEVAPGRVTVTCDGLPVLTREGAGFDGRAAFFQKRLGPYGFPPPGWAPRRPVGVFVFGAGVAVRGPKITPVR